MGYGRGDEKGKTRTIALALAFVFFTNNLVNGKQATNERISIARDCGSCSMIVL